MAKKKGTAKEVTKSVKEELFDTLGTLMANHYKDDINRLKGSCVPSECLVYTGSNGKDYTITITEKKDNIDFEDDHVVKVYEPSEEK